MSSSLGIPLNLTGFSFNFPSSYTAPSSSSTSLTFNLSSATESSNSTSSNFNIFYDGKSHFCYLLQSISNSRSYYIGYTDDPLHRLRQHNGEITGGAKKTLKNRPWKLICYITGFPNQRIALQWEWAWQKRVLKNTSDNLFSNVDFNATSGSPKIKNGRKLRNPVKRLNKLLTLEQVVSDTVPSNLLSLQIIRLNSCPEIAIDRFPGRIILLN